MIATAIDRDVFLSRIKAEVQRVDKDATVILFGSRARGDHKEDSDWDILVLTSRAADSTLENKISDSVYSVELEFLQPVSTIVIERKQWEEKHRITDFYSIIASEGLTL